MMQTFIRPNLGGSVFVDIVFVSGRTQRIECYPEVGEQYATYQQVAFMNGLLSSGWFAKTDIDGNVHAYPVTQIESIRFEFVAVE